MAALVPSDPAMNGITKHRRKALFSFFQKPINAHCCGSGTSNLATSCLLAVVFRPVDIMTS